VDSLVSRCVSSHKIRKVLPELHEHGIGEESLLYNTLT
jgi:hypothetical protein